MDSEATLGLTYGFLPPDEEGFEEGVFCSSAMLSPFTLTVYFHS
jgi:hypothetical protein